MNIVGGGQDQSMTMMAGAFCCLIVCLLAGGYWWWMKNNTADPEPSQEPPAPLTTESVPEKSFLDSVPTGYYDGAAYNKDRHATSKPPVTSKAPCKGTPVELSWYSWQNNVPCNSSSGHNGNKLQPFISVAVPSHMLNKHPIGSAMFIEQLKGKATPGDIHSGWVRVDDVCNEPGCTSSSKRPIVRLYIGDFLKSRAECTKAGQIRFFRNQFTRDWALPITNATVSCRTTSDAKERAFKRKYLGIADGPGECGVCPAPTTKIACIAPAFAGTDRKACTKK